MLTTVKTTGTSPIRFKKKVWCRYILYRREIQCLVEIVDDLMSTDYVINFQNKGDAIGVTH